MEILWLILLFLLPLSKAEQVPGDDIKCVPEFPHFSAGNINLTKDNYEDFKAHNKVFILGLSDSDCDKCCYMESMLDHLKNLLSTNFTYKGRPIPVARIDIKAARGSFAMDLPTTIHFPKILVYKDGSYYVYSSFMHYPLILHFINRVLYPSLELKTIEDIDKFLDVNVEWPDRSPFYDYGSKYEEVGHGMFPKRLVRAIAFIGSKQDYKKEIKDIKFAVQRLSPRDDFRFAFVYKMDTIKVAKQLHPTWFSKYSTTSLILQRSRNDVAVFDLAADTTHYFYWFTEYNQA